MSPEQIGQAVWVVVSACVCLAVLVWAARARPRSRALTRAAIGCALAVFPLTGLGLLTRGAGASTAVGVALGVACLLAGVLAAGLAVWALIARRADRGTRVIGPVLAVVLSPVAACGGLSMVLMPVLMGAGSNPWTYTSPDRGFRLTLPSDRWREVPGGGPGEVVRFGCSLPPMVASVREVRPAPTAAEYEAAVGQLQRLRAGSPVAAIDEQRGTTAAGHPCWYFLGREQTGNGIVVGGAVVWRARADVIVVTFEGQHRAASRYGQDQEGQTFRSAAVRIFTSVE